MSATTLTLKAPLSGVMVALDDVPDPVFAGRMVGDGISIDPTSNELLAPCDGKVVHIHAAHHALTIESDAGLEIMMHIGLDTVELKGDGFALRVRQGDSVRTGDALIGFDADRIATRATSLLTQIVITNAERVSGLRPSAGLVVAGQDDCLELTLVAADVDADGEPDSGIVRSAPVVVPNATGLHARPAAVLAALAKTFRSSVTLRKGQSTGNARSIVAIMALDVAQHDEITVLAQGPDADAAIEQLVTAIASGLGDDDAAPTASATPSANPTANLGAPARSADAALAAASAADGPVNILRGVPASPGLAVGILQHVRPPRFDIAEQATGPARDERRQLDDALDQARLQLDALRSDLEQRADASQAAIFSAHQELLGDPQLLELAGESMAAGQSAAFAWQQSVEQCASQLAALNNPLLAARAADLRDVGQRVLRLLVGEANAAPDTYPENCILVAEDLSPSQTASLDLERVLGFATVAGGASSHVAILARALDLPAVAGIDPRALQTDEGTQVVLDGGAGELRLNPGADEIARIRERQAEAATRHAEALAAASAPATTTDGVRIEIAANAGGVDDARKAVDYGAEGVGLLRTEFLFLERASAPDEDEQATSYGEILATMGADRPVIVRTLDVGGDKPLPYLPLPPEDNPFLGERGIRVGLARPELLRTQLRAIFRAAPRGRARIMFPMIASVDELRTVKKIVEEERQRLGAEPLELGIMVEVPSAALLARQFAAEVDFFSIGTNDLTQYTLAMDRGHPRLAPQCDALHPAVLQLIDQTVRGASEHATWVGVCGGIASDPQAVPILLGLGVTELSLSVPAIPGIKAQIRELSMTHCRELAARALAADSAAQVRALAPAPS